MYVRINHIVIVILVLSFAGLWLFGRERPAGVVVTERGDLVPCRDCLRTGSVNCRGCGGFGTVDAAGTCGKCKGSGKHEWKFRAATEARCQACRGTGRVDARSACRGCGGSGKAVCERCRGAGTWVATERVETVMLQKSYWERLLSLVRLPLEVNPPPQKARDGAYSIVQVYSRHYGKQWPNRVVSWGEFEQQGEEWRMVATVEFIGRTNSTLRNVEFRVRNRELAEARVVP
ncbi:MAG TPA: hypothetical protein PKE55_02555 [Kiritimatiellia bacterium]|nr:hypothetical protein [Kiritimatiellia bacterium]